MKKGIRSSMVTKVWMSLLILTLCAAPAAAKVSAEEAAAGEEGLVSTEDVMKGYVWISEIQGVNAYTLTYEDLAERFGADGILTEEEYSEAMQASFRHYEWISREDDEISLRVSLKQGEDGIYRVSGYKSSGFTNGAAAVKYLKELQEESAAAEAGEEKEERQTKTEQTPD